jgi:hypothetical protein
MNVFKWAKTLLDHVQLEIGGAASTH